MQFDVILSVYFSAERSFVEKIFNYALESSSSKSTLVHSLSVCISLLDPKKPAPSLFHSFRSQHLFEPPIPVKPETVNAMLPKLGIIEYVFVNITVMIYIFADFSF